MRYDRRIRHELPQQKERWGGGEKLWTGVRWSTSTAKCVILDEKQFHVISNVRIKRLISRINC
jgi:hypothetical protein